MALSSLNASNSRRSDGDDDGLVVAERQYWTMLELLAQLGKFVPMPEG